MRRALLALGTSLCVGGLLWTLTIVAHLAAEERDYHGPLASVGELAATHATLGRLSLARGQRVSFSVCSTDAFVSPAWKWASFAIFHHAPTALVLRVQLDEARMRSLREGPGGGCVDLARADALSGEGEFSVVVEGASSPPSGEAGPVRDLAPADTRVWTHVVALRPLMATQMGAPLLAWLGVLLLTLAWLVRPPVPSAFERIAAEELRAMAPSPEPTEEPTNTEQAVHGGSSVAAPRPARVLAFGLAGLALTFAASAALPASPLRPMGAALVLFVGQLALAFALARGGAALGLSPPPRGAWLLLAMPVLGVGLRLGLAPLARLVPSTGVAPIEQLVSAPSGLLTMLAIGLVAPFAEELFFRGLLFRQLEALRGPRGAALVTALLFAALHAPQAFGAWPSLLSIACAGAVFSLLRWLTGSTLSSVLAHLGYNGAIALPFVASHWVH